ncbi:MAG TPA: IclR family transcriptional regulator [Magnetospirillaceae bacterium]|nr:IclR family transcriptional regulator [Magnetospirillaceae bacterium]
MSEIKVQSLDRAFGILGILALDPNGRSLAAVAEEERLPKSTVFRLLYVLTRHGYVRKHPETGLYRLGPAFLELSSRYLNRLELRTEASTSMGELAAALGTIVFLARRQGSRIVYIDKQDQYTSLRKYSIIGQQKPVYCTALGKALLLDLEDDEVRDLLAGETFERTGPNTHAGVEDLLPDLRACRGRGWTRDNEEAEPGMQCVAAPVRDYRGEIIASLSTAWVPESRPDLTPERAAVHVVRAAETVSRAMGWGGIYR